MTVEERGRGTRHVSRDRADAAVAEPHGDISCSGVLLEDEAGVNEGLGIVTNLEGLERE